MAFCPWAHGWPARSLVRRHGCRTRRRPAGFQAWPVKTSLMEFSPLSPPRPHPGPQPSLCLKTGLRMQGGGGQLWDTDPAACRDSDHAQFAGTRRSWLVTSTEAEHGVSTHGLTSRPRSSRGGRAVRADAGGPRSPAAAPHTPRPHGRGLLAGDSTGSQGQEQLCDFEGVTSAVGTWP